MTTPTQMRREARARYEQGVRAYRSQQFKEAVQRFLEADALWPSAPLSFNTALAYDKLHDTGGALRFYRDYLRRDPSAKNAETVQARIDVLERQVFARGAQQLTVFSEPSGATVWIDGQPRGIAPWTGEVPPGVHQVTLSLDGYFDAERRVEVSKREAVDVSIRLAEKVTLAKAAEPAALEPPVEVPIHAAKAVAPTQRKDFGIWPWVSVAAGGVALASASAFELARRKDEDEARAAGTQIRYAQHLDEMQSHQLTARVLAGVGGIFAVAGGVLLLVDADANSEGRQSHTRIACGPSTCMGSWTRNF